MYRKTCLTRHSWHCGDLGQDFAEFPGAGKFRIRKPGNPTLRIQFQVDLFGLRAPRRHARQVRIEKQLVLFTAHPDRVELLESEADRIDQIVAARAHLVARVHGQPLAIGDGLGFLNRRQIGIHARRWRRHLLTEKLLPNEEAAAGWRCFVGLARKRQK